MNLQSKIYIAGHRGLVGSTLFARLKKEGYKSVVGKPSSELDLKNQAQVDKFFRTEKPEIVILTAAKVGGIYANQTYPADFIYDNLMIQTNVIQAAFTAGVRKLLFLGSSCMYPRDAVQPTHEGQLFTGPVEPTNAAYAEAKLAGLVMVQSYRKQHGANFITAIPSNLYGPNDNFDPENGHVIASLIRRFHQAKLQGDNEVVLWGSGKPVRDFLFAEDLVDALLLLLKDYAESAPINIGSGRGISISEVAPLISEIVEYEGKIRFDTSKSDGAPVKLLDSSKIQSFGWKPKTSLREGLKATYLWAKTNHVLN